MKVLHLIDSGGLYGAERVVLELIRAQLHLDLQPILGSIARPGSPAKEIEAFARELQITVRRFWVGRGPDIMGAYRIACYARHEKVDLVHCHGYKANILIGMLPGPIRRIPYLVTLHGWTDARPWSRAWLYAWADALLAKRAKSVVVVAEAMRCHARVASLGITPCVIRNGIPAIDQRAIPASPPWNSYGGFAKGTYTIGTIGRLAPEKGHVALIEAVENVLNSGRNVRLVLIGDGPERQALEHLAVRRGVIDKVHFTGYVRQAWMHLPSFDLFVLSSVTEGLPITILEAMRAGVPIIATRVGGIPDALGNGECGVLVEPGNVHELAEAIIKNFDDPSEAKERCRRGKIRVQSHFSSNGMAREYLVLYKQLNGNRRVPD